MPNFIVPAVGNPNGGFADGDQVTADNLNAHVTEAIPTGDFIAGRTESFQTDTGDYYLKVDSNGDIYKIDGNLITATAQVGRHTSFFTNNIYAIGGNGVSGAFGSIGISDTNQLTFNIGAYSDPNDYTGGAFSVTGNTHTFYFKGPYAYQTNNNIFRVGTSNNKSSFQVYANNATITCDEVIGLSCVKGLSIPAGTTAQRPMNGNVPSSDGIVRFNSDTSDIEFSASGAWNSISSRATGLRTGYVGTAGTGIVYRSTAEFDIPADETWIFSIDAHWSTPAGGNTQPGYWFETAIFATKATYTDVELKRYYTNYTPYSGINRLSVSIPLTKTLLGNLSKKIEIRTYATNNSTTLATFTNLGSAIPGGTQTNWFSVKLVKVKTTEFTSINAIL